MKYAVDAQEYLDRQRRAMRAQGKVDGRLDMDAMRAILAEVGPLELEAGRYRIRILGGRPEQAHKHLREEATGREFVLEHPDVAHPEWLELELTYRGRAPAGGPFQGLLLFTNDAAELAALADMDIMSLDGPL